MNHWYGPAGSLQPKPEKWPSYLHHYICIKPIKQYFFQRYIPFSVGQVFLIARYGKTQKHIYVQYRASELRLPPEILREHFKRL